MNSDLKAHWERIYRTKSPAEVSWTQEIPAISLEFIQVLNLPKDAKIIDVGGGDSLLVDYLLREGYSQLTVLDISSAAIERAKYRLGKNAERVNWMVCDILDFNPSGTYDLWHDRAAFHFQIIPENIRAYLSIMNRSVTGYAVIGSFSTYGPTKCSGLEIRQYDEESLRKLFEEQGFTRLSCKNEDHITPSGNIQNFLFCSFKKTDETELSRPVTYTKA